MRALQSAGRDVSTAVRWGTEGPPEGFPSAWSPRVGEAPVLEAGESLTQRGPH